MAHRLLVMDDSVTIRRVVELTFAGGDVQVVGVADGRAALERIDAEPPDLILADVGTSPPDGYEVSASVKRNEALAHIPVLLLSGAFQPIDEGRALASGCDGVLAKPFDPEVLAARVRALLGVPDGQPSDPPLPGPGGDDLLAFFERLLAEPIPPECEPWTVAGVDGPGASAPAGHEEVPPPPSERDPFSLDDYFDLVDEFLATSPVLATAPSPSPGAPPHPPRSSSTACSGCPRESSGS